MSATPLAQETAALLAKLGVDLSAHGGSDLPVQSPIDGSVIASLKKATAADMTAAIDRAHAAYLKWRSVPAPKRGELIRRLGLKLREVKADLGRLVTIEAGKIISEGQGEVQEMIDVCDFAVGLSRQLYGLTIATERPSHRMMETWHPVGVVGVITAFNFPVAVWSWNAAIAFVCGDSVVWKPSDKTPLTALAVQALFKQVADEYGAPEGLSELVICSRAVGEVLVDDPRVPVLSATGSTAMGQAIGPKLAHRFARPILELGGNNAAIIAPTADLDLVVRGVAFAAIGTAGQRCTSLRRLIVHEDIYDALIPRLKKAYASVKIGDPREAGVLVGPLIDRKAFENMQAALAGARAQGGKVTGGERAREDLGAEAFYVRPSIAEMPGQTQVVHDETFAPILYVMRYKTFAEALALHNEVPQGLSSSVFTNDLREAELFLSAEGSDCGIANVNIGPSGAEIGGAFGGEKETGGGRESGSDAWKAYMRRSTNTINYGHDLPLAQGVTFDVE